LKSAQILPLADIPEEGALQAPSATVARQSATMGLCINVERRCILI
jgi:hypothetical protein